MEFFLDVSILIVKCDCKVAVLEKIFCLSRMIVNPLGYPKR